MQKVFRWYISRKYKSQKIEKEGISHVEAIITPEDDQYSGPLHPKDLRDLVKLNNDRLEWWLKGDENQLEGWTQEETLINVLRTKNVFSKYPELEITPKERAIEENMVFLHFVRDVEKLTVVLNSLKDQVEFPNLNKLIDIEDALWLDFTPHARNMARTLYHKVLGEEQEDKDASK